MFTTIDGAKKRVDTLFRAFQDGGLLFPRNRCEEALARAAGFEDWQALVNQLLTSTPTGDKDRFRQRLMKALPAPCRQPALAWLENHPREKFDASGRRPYFIYDVAPYVLEAMGSYRRNQPLIRIGSGQGQRLRETLVLGRLMNMIGESGPWLEPDTCALVYKGYFAVLFADTLDQPRFQIEFDKLVDAGVFHWTPGPAAHKPGTLKLLPPLGIDPMDGVTKHHGSKIKQWFEWPEYRAAAVTTLWEALASLGIADAQRVAEAIVSQGAQGYLSESGPVLDLLSQQAADGELETLARTVTLFCAMHPKNAGNVRRAVPAKIGSQYLARHPKVRVDRLLAWGKSRPEWPGEIIQALRKPAFFPATVSGMIEEISALT